jgi:hypothetical protein
MIKQASVNAQSSSVAFLPLGFGFAAASDIGGWTSGASGRGWGSFRSGAFRGGKGSRHFDQMAVAPGRKMHSCSRCKF